MQNRTALILSETFTASLSLYASLSLPGPEPMQGIPNRPTIEVALVLNFSSLKLSASSLGILIKVLNKRNHFFFNFLFQFLALVFSTNRLPNAIPYK